MTTYMEKYPRRNGVAAKKPGFWKKNPALGIFKRNSEDFPAEM